MQTPNAPATKVPNVPAEQTAVAPSAAPELGAGLSMPTLAVLGVIGAIVLTAITPTTSCNLDSNGCGGPITTTTTGTR